MSDTDELIRLRTAIKAISELSSYDRDYDSGMSLGKRWPGCEPPEFPGDYIDSIDLTRILRLVWHDR